jgi:prepilin-type N-terminal cleavage/methylation domain-containing protein
MNSVAKVKKMKKAFTLIELVVSIALLAIIFLFATMIFKVSINSYRTSVANAEIMQKLRAITDQLNADFKGVLWNPGGKINFLKDSNDIRSDSIIFFANGDFQSTEQHSSSNKTVVGNVACIFYALNTPTSTTEPREKILVRRQTIITADSVLDPCNLDPTDHFPGEYSNTKSLAQLIAEKFDANSIMSNTSLDPMNKNDFAKLSVMYMAKGVDNFTIQYVGTENPADPSKKFNDWRPKNSEVIGWPKELYPIAFKFTFTLYDSKAIIKEGRTFTHIVYLRD